MAETNLPADTYFLNIPRKPILTQRSIPEAPVIQEQIKKPIIIEEIQNEQNEPGRVQENGISLPNVQNEPTVLVKDITEEEMMDSIPYHERNVTIHMPFFPMDIAEVGMDEFRNAGSVYMEFLKDRALEILQSPKLQFVYNNRDEERILPAPNEIKAVIVHLLSEPISFEHETMAASPDVNVYNIICSTLADENQPIYVITEKTAYQVSAEEFLELYEGSFALSFEKKEGDE